MIVGVDVGGANIKASILREGPPLELRSTKLHNPLWLKGPESLRDSIKRAVDRLGGLDETKHVAITMTAELSDVFKDKREGVEFTVKAAEEALGDVRIINVHGKLLKPKDAVSRYMEVAAANWWSVGWFSSLIEDNCIVIDVGSTTTTITPVVNGT
ncbi:MAG: hydantoinase/oxoprolinase family protein, partial [Thermoproteota archaeon]